MFEWAAELPVSITVCDKKGVITYVNDKSRKTFTKDADDELIGKNLKDCHSSESTTKIFHPMDTNKSNIYTIEKRSKKKMIIQVPWFMEMKLVVWWNFQLNYQMKSHILLEIK